MQGATRARGWTYRTVTTAPVESDVLAGGHRRGKDGEGDARALGDGACDQRGADDEGFGEKHCRRLLVCSLHVNRFELD